MTLTIEMTRSHDIKLIDGVYSIELPCTPAGFQVLRSILQARLNEQTKLATPGAPTQRMVDAELAKQVREYYDRTLPGMDMELDL
jgi:hypothetical protein